LPTNILQEQDVYICPAKYELDFNKTIVSRDKTMFIYTSDNCKDCHLKHKCTKAKQRTVSRWEHEDILEEMERRMQADPQIIKQRQWLVEHPFGTIKRSFNQGYMLLRGLDKVRCEFSLSALAYNIKRVINIVGIEAMIAATAG